MESPIADPTAKPSVVPTEQLMTSDGARIRELLLINLFQVFSERDPERRMKAISANYTEDVIWSDFEKTTFGRAALNERAQIVLDGAPGFEFSATSPVHVLRDFGWLPFVYGVPEHPPAVIGSDAAIVRDGRIAVLYTLMNGSTDKT